MLFNYQPNLTRNVFLVLVLSLVFIYQKDESNVESKADSFENYPKESLRNRIHIGIAKYSSMRLQQSTNDSRQL